MPAISPFSYLAFDEMSQDILGYGFTATEALAKADLADPGASIYVLDCGALGRKIWFLRMALSEAKRIIERPRSVAFWLWLTGGGEWLLLFSLS